MLVYVIFLFYSGHEKDGRIKEIRRVCVADISVLIKPSYLVAVKWPTGRTV